MKKILACILTLALLVGILPAALGAGSTAAAATPKSIKILSIGEEFSRSGFDYMYKVLEAEGYTDISAAYLHGGFKHGISITDYAAGLANEEKTYHFNCNFRDFAEDLARDYSVKMAVEKEDWDYIVLNTNPIQSGQASEFMAALDTMVTYINQHKTNPNAKIGWHMNWAYQQNCDYVAATSVATETAVKESFKTVYGSDPAAMYAAITQAAQQVKDKVDLIVPVGTAIMNMKSSYLNDVQVDEGELVVDGANLTELGKLVASYTWYAKLTGKELEDLSFTDAFLVDLSTADRKVVAEAVNNAVKNPYQLTESSYKTEPVQYNAVVNGTTTRHLPGETVAISTKVALNAGRKFLNWSAVKGDVNLADAGAQTTTFKMPAQDVEIKAVYQAEETAGQLKVGFGRVDVTPDYKNNSVPLAGYGGETTRLANGLYHEEDRLTLTAVAISDGNQTNVITTMDFLNTPYKEWIDAARVEVEEKLGLPGMNLIYSATHTHEGPAWYGNHNSSYRETWLAKILEVVETALNDLEPVSETKISITQVPGMNWNRHYRSTDGSVSGSNFNTGGYLGVFRSCDQDLQLIRFVRDNAKDVVLINWCGHATRNYRNADDANTPDVDESQFQYKLSADYPGAMRRYLEQLDEDCLAAFFLGSSGNMNVTHVMDTALKNRWGATRFLPDGETYGKRLAQYAFKAMENMTTVETGAVHSVNQQQSIFESDSNYSTLRTVPQEAVSIGSSIAFVTAAYEMFDRNAMDVKQASPFDITFVLTCSGPNVGYVPEWQTWFYPYLPMGKKAYEADKSKMGFATVQGAGEDLADGLSAMLDILYAK